jgi:nitronate monooxygenase
MVLGFWDLDVPIVGAPMAGGPGTPALAAAVSNAGGLGFLAGGYVSADRLANDIAAARAATTGPIGVNLFVPQPSVADVLQLDHYAELLDELAEHYGVEVGYPTFGDDDGWQQKLEVVADLRPELVSFTFGVRGRSGRRGRRGWFGRPGSARRRAPRHVRARHGTWNHVAERAAGSHRSRP